MTTHSPKLSHAMSFARLDFDQAPFLVIWETTQACPLACQHCRAEARELRDPAELSTEEGKRLLDAVHAMGTPVCVLSGGDPLRRPDLCELIRHGADLGLRMATIPAASRELTRDKLVGLKEAGLSQVAFSLDGPTAEAHDTFRQVPGTFAKTMEAAAWAHELEMPMQINTTFARHNIGQVDAMVALVRTLGVVFWEVFSLVPTGRGKVLDALNAEEHELLFKKLYQLSGQESFIIKATEAPHFRRYILQQREAEGNGAGGHPGGHPGGARPVQGGSAIPAQLSRDMSTSDSFGTKAKGINAGKGFCFVSHMGDVFPSGFLPIPVGNVRQTPLATLYRDSPLMRRLRDPAQLSGRCGVCQYVEICGGSRARAYALTGDAFAEDEACAYQP